MKKCRRLCALILSLLLILCLLSGCGEEESGTVEVLEPSEQLYVNDDAGILSNETEQYVTGRVNALKQLCGGEIAVVTIDFLPSGLNSEEYAYELINQWGVGDAEKNNGVVLLLVPGEAKGWITAGSGIERSLTAGKLDQILNLYLWNDFDNGEYDIAVRNTVDAVLEWFESYYGITVGTAANAAAGFGGGAAVEPAGYSDAGGDSSMDYLIVIIILFIILMSLSSGSRRGGGGSRIFFLPFFFNNNNRRPPFGGGFGTGPNNRRPPGGFGGGGFGGGGFSGGSFGGGGGRGGGAGRR